MDEADRAQTEIEYALIRQVFAAGKILSIGTTGFCLNCGDALPTARRWCDSGCRDDWARTNDLGVTRRSP